MTAKMETVGTRHPSETAFSSKNDAESPTIRKKKTCSLAFSESYDALVMLHCDAKLPPLSTPQQSSKCGNRLFCRSKGVWLVRFQGT